MTKTVKNNRQDHYVDIGSVTASQVGWAFAWQLAKREMRGSLGRFRVF